jgi:hypothetical protein
MGDTFAIMALRRKRAHLAGEIEKAQRALARNRDTLATLDAVTRLFEPASNPDLIPSIRPCSARCLYFRRGEVARLSLAALREAGKPVSTRYITEHALAAKGLDVDPLIKVKITETVRQALGRLAAKGITRKVIQWPEAWWELAS